MFEWLERNPYYVSKRIFDNQKGETDGYDWVKYHELKFANPMVNGELLLYISDIPVCMQWSFINNNMFIQSIVCHHDNGPQWIIDILEQVYEKHDEYLKEQGLELLTVMPTRKLMTRNNIFEPDIDSVISERFVFEHTLSKEDKIQELEQTPIDYLNLSQRPLIQLKKSGIVTIGQLLSYPIEDLHKIERLGVRSIDEVTDCIYKIKRHFHM